MKIITAIFLVVATLLGAVKVVADSGSEGEQGSMPEIKQSVAIFSGGCFWCMQPAFDKLPGVISTVVGYTGGPSKNPTYDEVTTGSTGHRESIRVSYDPAKVGYEKLVETFWHTIDPTQSDGQFADRGSHYRTAIFYSDEEQRQLAEKSKLALQSSGKFTKPIVTEILPATDFYPAEDYHQAYYKKNSGHYNAYKVGSGRAGFIERTWGKSE